MELLLKIIGIAFVAATCYVLLKSTQPQIGSLLMIAAGVLILFLLGDALVTIVTTLTNLGAKAGMDASVLSSLLKIVGIGYLTEYAVSLCRDADCVSLGKKIEFGGKIVILLSTLPLIENIVKLLEGIL